MTIHKGISEAYAGRTPAGLLGDLGKQEWSGADRGGGEQCPDDPDEHVGGERLPPGIAPSPEIAEKISPTAVTAAAAQPAAAAVPALGSKHGVSASEIATAAASEGAAMRQQIRPVVAGSDAWLGRSQALKYVAIVISTKAKDRNTYANTGEVDTTAREAR